MSASNMSFNRPLLQVCFLERTHPRLEPFMLCSQISDPWSMNFTVGRPKLRAQIAAALQLSCRNAYLSIAFAPQALPNADKNGVSSPPRWIWSNKNPFRQNRHLCNAQVQSLLYQAVCWKMTKNVKVLLDSFLVDKKNHHCHLFKSSIQ